jgi:transcriptional regulator with XRE-family HTH domain
VDPVPTLPRTTLSRLDPGRLIRDARRSAGLTQGDLARRLGTAQSAVSGWERGHDIPRVTTLARILKACGYEADLEFRHRSDVDRSQIIRGVRLTPTERAEAFQVWADSHAALVGAKRVPTHA